MQLINRILTIVYECGIIAIMVFKIKLKNRKTARKGLPNVLVMTLDQQIF